MPKWIYVQEIRKISQQYHTNRRYNFLYLINFSRHFPDIVSTHIHFKYLWGKGTLSCYFIFYFLVYGTKECFLPRVFTSVFMACFLINVSDLTTFYGGLLCSFESFFFITPNLKKKFLKNSWLKRSKSEKFSSQFSIYLIHLKLNIFTLTWFAKKWIFQN